MRNFVFHNPTKIIFGRDTIPAIGGETAAYADKIMLVYGQGSIKKNGIHKQVIQALSAAGLKIIEYGGVRPNPTLSRVREGINRAKQNGVEAIVAVGGGSVIDSAKAIAAGTLAEHDVWKFFTGKKSIKKTLPITCVLTLAASGSEMNGGMVVTHDEKNLKFGFANRLLHPKVSILDPAATFSVPADYTAYGAVDAIAHVLEIYCNAAETGPNIQDRIMESLAKTIMENCSIALRDPKNYKARANLMWSATLALNGLTAAGLGKVGFPMHLIEHAISGLFDTAHGAGLSVVVPGWLTWQAHRSPTKFAQFAQRVFKVDTGEKIDRGLEGIQRLKNWFAVINSPVSLYAIGISTREIPKIASNVMKQAKIWRMSEYTTDRVEEILRLCV